MLVAIILIGAALVCGGITWSAFYLKRSGVKVRKYYGPPPPEHPNCKCFSNRVVGNAAYANFIPKEGKFLKSAVEAVIPLDDPEFDSEKWLDEQRSYIGRMAVKEYLKRKAEGEE